MGRILRETMVILTVIALALAFSSPVANAQLTEAQKKLLARRAAQVDAYRNLAEKVKGLRITSNTYVRDFVALSDQIDTDLNTFLKGAEVTLVRYLSDGTCEVEVSMPVRLVIKELRRLHRVHWERVHTFRIQPHDFARITTYYTEDLVRAQGWGVPRSEESSQESVSSSPTSGIPGWENVTARGRLMAERAAKVDAYRNLAEIIKGLRITSNTYVRDFVAESDQISTRLDAFIKGARQIGPYRYTPEGICEVDVEITVQEVIKKLKEIRKWYIRGRYPWRRVYIKTIRFEKIVAYYPKRVIQATGQGVPPAKYIKQGSTVPSGSSAAPAWVGSSLKATGVGISPEGSSGSEASLMAERAAEVDARRNLAEEFYGVQIDAATTVRDFVVQHDEVKAKLETFLRGARKTDTRFLADGSIEVDVEIPLQGLWEVVKEY
jgi:hypothetical protein